MVKNTLFSLRNCPFCEIASLGILEANNNLPLGRRVRIIETLPHELNGKPVVHPTVNGFMTGLNGREDLGEWGFPETVLCNLGVVEFLGNYRLGVKHRVLVRSAFTSRQFKNFIQAYMDDDLSR